ncbi:MAG: dihydrofolate reductase family protein [Candidatus Dormibacteraeota bacterium]|nr:dihydrofolate reductase family protein [Candidatus Dormibacteraeota bacterium]
MAQRVIAGITMSLDGYITGPNDRPGAGLGEGGERLHWWVFGGPWTYETGARGDADPVDQEYLGSVFPTGGAMLVGRWMYEAAEGWGDDPGFGVPAFVVTHRPHPRVVKGTTSFDFVTDGFAAAVARAREAAGERNVLIMGGGDVLRQSLDAGIVDQLTLTIAPVLLGGGKRLFDGMQRLDTTFERTRVVESPWATHLQYRVKRRTGEE